MNYSVFILPFSLLLLSGISFADSSTPKSTYNWTGVYVGGFAGGASSAKTTTSEPTSNNNGATFLGESNPSFSYDTNSSFIGGGYNWLQLANWKNSLFSRT